MLRGAAGVCRRCVETATCAYGCQAARGSTALDTLHAPSIPHAHTRLYGAHPAANPHPEINPEPTPRVLELVDGVENLTVKELVWFNKILQERLGISDAELGIGVPMAGMQMPPQAGAEAPAAAEEPKVEEKTAFDVVVEGYEASSKIKIIKQVRELVPGLGLKEGKELVRV